MKTQKMKTLLLTYVAILTCLNSFSQGFEGLIVDKIPVSKVAADADPHSRLTTSHYTYRIFVNMAEGYEYQLMQGAHLHPLVFKTTTTFYNDEDDGVLNPADIRNIPTQQDPLYYDSWITIGGYGSRATATQLVPLSEDSDGTADGFFGDAPSLQMNLSPDLNLDMFDYKQGESFESDNASIYLAGGITGAGTSNSVCIGQFTTDGDFYAELNVTMRMVGSKNPEKYFANENPITSIIGGTVHIGVAEMIYPLPAIKGCMDNTACNFNEKAEKDDGSCVYASQNCITCTDKYPFWAMLDDDNDEICNSAEISGCTNKNACNYNSNATEDDGSCIVPDFGCSACKNGQLIILDYDNDGICNKDDAEGCRNPSSCNFNQFATIDDGQCSESPEKDCAECYFGEYIIVDSDYDGICNKYDDSGCTNPDACNFNPYASLDEGCLFEDSCNKCEKYLLVLLDSDNNGICDLLSPAQTSVNEQTINPIEAILYPNPAVHTIMIKTEDNSTQAFRVDILSVTGILMSSQVYIARHGVIGEINIAHLLKGMYTIRISDTMGISISKLFNKQ